MPLTWTDLVTAEPRLDALEKLVRLEAEIANASPNWSFSVFWSYTLRPAVNRLVGFERSEAEPAQLRTEQAWNTAISHLISLLPEEDGAWAS